MQLYLVASGSEAGPSFSASLRKAKKIAQADANYTGSNAEVWLCNTGRPTKALVIAALTGQPVFETKQLVYTAQPWANSN